MPYGHRFKLIHIEKTEIEETSLKALVVLVLVQFYFEFSFHWISSCKIFGFLFLHSATGNPGEQFYLIIKNDDLTIFHLDVPLTIIKKQ